MLDIDVAHSSGYLDSGRMCCFVLDMCEAQATDKVPCCCGRSRGESSGGTEICRFETWGQDVGFRDILGSWMQGCWIFLGLA